MGISLIKQEIGAAKEGSSNLVNMVYKICCICMGTCKKIYTKMIFVNIIYVFVYYYSDVYWNRLNTACNYPRRSTGCW